MTGVVPPHPGSAAYPSADLQADPVLLRPRVSGNPGSQTMTFRPYVYGLSRESLRPVIG